MQHLFRRTARLLLYHLTRPQKKTPWKWLRHYPHIEPTPSLLQQWQTSEWPEYQRWLDDNSIVAVDQWLSLHRGALSWKTFPKISIIVPVYNTAPEILKTCILSVRLQTSPFWELILSDAGSKKAKTQEVLRSSMCHDPRIKVVQSTPQDATGISDTTNRGIAQATGDFILFLDHDDRLAPEALQEVSEVIRNDPTCDIIYSDRDMLSPKDKRFMHLMKPRWSPENLYSGNYIFHLMCYKKSLVNAEGNLRPEFDGSQDYDLILRCMEHNPKVVHIPKVLYHWRQHVHSVALDGEVKSYAFEAGIKALQEALTRRGILGSVSENDNLWRGNYQIKLPSPDNKEISRIAISSDDLNQNYTRAINNHLSLSIGKAYILIQSEAYQEIAKHSLEDMAAWLNIEPIGMVSGCVIDDFENLVYAGMTINNEGQLIRPYSGFPIKEPGYMAVTKIVRNISLPDPFSVIIHKNLWDELEGFDPCLKGPLALLDLALRALEKRWRIIYLPTAVFKNKSGWAMDNSPKDHKLFLSKWSEWIHAGDPCYSRNISPSSINYELNHK